MRFILLAVLVTVLSIATAAVIVQLRRDQHAGGDPGGRIMAVLTETEIAIPTHADIAYRHDEGPRWDSCDGMDGTYGWDDIVFQVHFASSKPVLEIIGSADAALSAEGWSRTQLSPEGAAVGAVWAQNRRLPDASVDATVSLSQDTPDREWTLFATAPPIGRHASGC